MTLYDETRLRAYAYNQIQLSSFLDQVAERVRSLEEQLAQIVQRDGNGEGAPEITSNRPQAAATAAISGTGA